MDSKLKEQDVDPTTGQPCVSNEDQQRIFNERILQRMRKQEYYTRTNIMGKRCIAKDFETKIENQPAEK